MTETRNPKSNPNPEPTPNPGSARLRVVSSGTAVETDDITSQPVQTTLDLPFDDCVPFALTPLGRDHVQPPIRPGGPRAAPLPSLDDPGDPRSGRARALRRAGLQPAGIARILGIDELAVRVWIGDARPVAIASSDSTAPLPSITPEDRAFDDTRRTAAADLPTRLGSIGFIRGLSLVAAAATIDRHAVLVTTGDRDVASRAVTWLIEHAGADRHAVRAVVQLGDRRGGDLAARRWADALSIDHAQVRVTVWTAPPHPAAVQVLLRIADPRVAATVTGWRDALLGADDPDDARHRQAF